VIVDTKKIFNVERIYKFMSKSIKPVMHKIDIKTKGVSQKYNSL